jgi:hypothetical protein
MKFRRSVTLSTAVLLVGALAVPANGFSLSWEDLEVDGPLAGLGINESDLREYRPNAMYSYAGGTIPDPNDSIENPLPPLATSLEASRVYLGGQQPFFGQASLIRTLPTSWDPPSDTRVCEDLDDVNCAGQQLEISANLPVCSQLPGFTTLDQVSEPCIVGVSEITGSVADNGSSATFDRYVDNRLTALFKSGTDAEWLNPDMQGWADDILYLDEPGWAASGDVPRGAAASLWSLGSEDFFARATLSVFKDADGNVSIDALDTQLVRYKLYEKAVSNDVFRANFFPPAWVTKQIDGSPNSYESFPIYSTSPMVSFNDLTSERFVSCAFEELTDTHTRCGIALRHLDGKRYQMQLLIPEELGGWFHGRLADANLTLDAETYQAQGLNLLTVAGDPVQVPTTSIQFTLCDAEGSANRTYQDYIYSEDPDYSLSQCERPIGERGNGDHGHWSPNGDQAISDFTFFEDLIPDQAKGYVDMWSFATLPSHGTHFGPYEQCLAGTTGLQGMISTNAMVYKAGIPQMNNGVLEYQVASTARDVNNAVIQGDYTMVMRSDLARCIYNFGDRPITSANAQITVTGDDGIARTATTVFEDVDGWLTFKAQGFGFSAPTIGVAIVEPRAARTSPVSQVSKPRALSAPKLSMVPRVGTALSVANGNWREAEASTFSYQWFRCEAAFAARPKAPEGGDCKAIPGATASSYTPVNRDTSFWLAARVTAKNVSGQSSFFTASAPFGPKRLLEQTAPSEVRGEARMGQTLRATAGRWSHKSPKVSYLWYRCSTEVPVGLIRVPVQCESTGVSGASYEIKRQDVASHLMVRVSGTKAKQRAVGFVAAGVVAGR